MQPCDQVDLGPALLANVLSGWRPAVAERAADRLMPADRIGESERHVAAGTGKRANREVRGAPRRADLDPGGGGSQALLSLGVRSCAGVEKGHSQIMARRAARPGGIAAGDISSTKKR
jgi:hypothetical protein